MNTFIKTFLICLVLTLAFLSYRFVSGDSYSSFIPTSNSSPFSTQKTVKEDESVTSDNDYSVDLSKNQEQQNQKLNDEVLSKQDNVSQIYSHKCYFYSSNGELIPVLRELKTKPSLESEIMLLLKGPLINESKKGVYSEIPPNTDLIAVRKHSDKIIVDLSSNFGNGGGSESVENRIKQLSRTVKSIEPNKPIYLYINGKQVEYLGGDGVYIKQPLD